MRATVAIRPMVSRSKARIVTEAPVIRRYTSPCGVTFEAPEEAHPDRVMPQCIRCGSHRWAIVERPWGT